MAKPLKLYWDTCAWLGLLNDEPDKSRELKIVYGHARREKYELWTSTLSMVEARRLKVEEHLQKPLDEANEKKISEVFLQPFVKPVPVDLHIAGEARKIWRLTAGLTKYQDAVHLASALRWDIQVMHTYDHDDLLHLSGKFDCRGGTKLTICYPDETTDGPLFSKKIA